MIAVIADDFTGAAEIGGIGLRYGLNVVIETEPFQDVDADLLVVAADTRSLRADEASIRIEHITKALMKLRPDLIFKKIDSVLRGNIVGELVAQMKVSGKSNAIIVPANPALNRIIRNGHYYIDDIPLHKTRFSDDPQYPIKSPVAVDILRNEENLPLANLGPSEKLPEAGMVIGDVTNIEDLEKWAEKIDENTLPAGASGFFDAILKKKYMRSLNSASAHVPFGDKALIALGSAFPKDLEFLNKMKHNGSYLSNMPGEIYSDKNFNPGHLEKWAEDIVNAMKKYRRVFITVTHVWSEEPDIEFRVGRNIGDLIKIVASRTALKELVLEGGSTAFMVLSCLEIKKLVPVQELDTGVIRMKVDGMPGLHITTKPGSYTWPDHLWIPENVQDINNVACD